MRELLFLGGDIDQYDQLLLHSNKTNRVPLINFKLEEANYTFSPKANYTFSPKANYTFSLQAIYTYIVQANYTQKNTLVECMILSGADNHPPMLDNDLVTRTKKYVELSAAEKIQADCDMKATNIILQGSQCNKFKRDKVKAILVLVIRVMLLVPEETMQLDRQGLFNATTIKTKDLDTYDFDCDDLSIAKAVLMANISNYCSDVISETLILEEISRSKMSENEKDPEAVKQKSSNKPINYVKLNKIYEDFRKRFVPQQELSADEAFRYYMLNPSTKSSDALPVKIEAPKELPKVSLVNESLKKA
uniref:Uncharacterized protein n=1 Tax=Tanacetum cinerariifolium TaxID=118510 RepID=A0A6L2MMV5_TANCI|nr:hypothetical protein [Tanacetum cinerariifolium]